MKIFEIRVIEKSTGNFKAAVLDTRKEEPNLDLATDLDLEKAEQIVDDLNLVLKHYFKEYEPMI